MIPAGFDPFEALTRSRREALVHLIPMSGEMMRAPLAARADRVNSVLAAATVGYINALMAVYRLHG